MADHPAGFRPALDSAAAIAKVREVAETHDVIYVEGFGDDDDGVPERFDVYGTTHGTQLHKCGEAPDVWGYWESWDVDSAIAVITLGTFPSLDGPQDYDTE